MHSFPQKYQDLVRQIYSPEQIENTFRQRFNLLTWYNLALQPGKKFYLVEENACGLLLIQENIAYLGFLEGLSPEPYEKIIQRALEISQKHNVQQIFAPVELSIWFSHRLFDYEDKLTTKQNQAFSVPQTSPDNPPQEQVLGDPGASPSHTTQVKDRDLSSAEYKKLPLTRGLGGKDYESGSGSPRGTKVSEESGGANFFTEPASQPFYLNSLKNHGFEVTSRYHTFSRTEFAYIAKIVEPKLNDERFRDFRLKQISPSLKNFSELRKIYQLSRQSFEHRAGFRSINFLSFLLSNLKAETNNKNRKLNIEKIIFALYHQRNLIGFCYNFIQEDKGQKNFYAKTIVIDQKYRGHGLTNLFLYQIHNQAKDCDKIFYVAVKESNEVDKMPKDRTTEEGTYLLLSQNV